ncbi:MAG TPA: hypothetical protein VKB86_19400 [Pyrinomonadaceae bacterium]|nr:hypothetical protein [Pyrinomonadaceae bacterium]
MKKILILLEQATLRSDKQTIEIIKRHLSLKEELRVRPSDR